MHRRARSKRFDVSRETVNTRNEFATLRSYRRVGVSPSKPHARPLSGAGANEQRLGSCKSLALIIGTQIKPSALLL
jgi:hypothetical protein